VLVRNIVEAGYDFSSDETRYSITEENGAVYEVRIPLTGKAQAKPSPEVKISEWLDSHAVQELLVRIPGYHFQSF
jgi:hypothetical protein